MSAMDVDDRPYNPEDDFDENEKNVDILDEKSIEKIAMQIKEALDGRIVSLLNDTASHKHLEIEIAFGKQKYFIPNSPCQFSPKINFAPDNVREMVTHETSYPLRFSLPETWYPCNQFDRSINQSLFSNIEQALAEHSSLLNVIGHTSWYIQDYTSLDGLNDGSKIRLAHSEQYPENIILNDSIVIDQRTSDLLKLSYYNIVDSNREEEECLHDRHVSSTPQSTKSKKTVLYKRKGIRPSDQNVPKSFVSATLLTTVENNHNSVLKDYFSPWACDQSHSIRKTKLCQPMIIQTPFYNLFDMVLHINLEEHVYATTAEKSKKNSTKELVQILKTKKYAPQTNQTRIQFSDDGRSDSDNSSGQKTPPFIPMEIISTKTHGFVKSIVQCRKSFFLGRIGLYGADELEEDDLTNSSPLWRVDLTVAWRAPGGSRNHYIQHAQTWMKTQSCDDFDPLECPTLEVELECMDPTRVLIDCEGNYLSFTKTLMNVSWIVQQCVYEMILKNSNNLIESEKEGDGKSPTSSFSNQSLVQPLPDYIYYLSSPPPPLTHYQN